jgi:hypothetical protein
MQCEELIYKKVYVNLHTMIFLKNNLEIYQHYDALIRLGLVHTQHGYNISFFHFKSIFKLILLDMN